MPDGQAGGCSQTRRSSVVTTRCLRQTPCCLPQDFGATQRTGPATAGFVRLHLRLRKSPRNGGESSAAPIIDRDDARQEVNGPGMVGVPPSNIINTKGAGADALAKDVQERAGSRVPRARWEQLVLGLLGVAVAVGIVVYVIAT